MFERFTDRARRVLVLAQDEAKALGHAIGLEHMLIGCSSEGGGMAALMLRHFGVTPEALRAGLRTRRPGQEPIDTAAALSAVGVDLAQVQQAVRASFGDNAPFLGPSPEKPPFDDHAKGALEGALREALALGHNYIGTEHLLLSLLSHEADEARTALAAVDVDALQLREKLLAFVVVMNQVSAAPTSKRAMALRRGCGRLPDEARKDAVTIMRETLDDAHGRLLAEVARLDQPPETGEVEALLAPTAAAVEAARQRLAALDLLTFVDLAAQIYELDAWTILRGEHRRLSERVLRLREADPEVTAAAVRDRMEAETVEAAMWGELWDRYRDSKPEEIVRAAADRLAAIGVAGPDV